MESFKKVFFDLKFGIPGLHEMFPNSSFNDTSAKISDFEPFDSDKLAASRKGGFLGFELGLFDWNGTIQDDFPVQIRSLERVFEAFHVSVPSDLADRYRREVTSRWPDFYYKYGMPPHITPEEMNEERKRFFKQLRQQPPLREGAKIFLKICREELGLKTGVVSAEAKTLLYSRLRSLGLKKYLQAAWADVRDKKGTLSQACQFFNVKPCQTFYLDDTCQGIISAHEAGLFPIALMAPTSYSPADQLWETVQKIGALSVSSFFELTLLI